MILYIEKQAIKYNQTKKIISNFDNPNIIIIDNYKNIFDKNTLNYSLEKAIIIAELRSSSLSKAPKTYWYIDNSYFLKTSLNCVFNCSYCFLHGAFKNNYQLYFVNYNDIKKEIINFVKDEPICFYSSDYSDILWMNYLSNFVEEFVPFFENFNNSIMEIRTKSSNINSILDLGFVPKKTEFAFSLNPQSLIDKYEIWSSSLDDRIKSINILLERGFIVGIRFLPLLPVENYQIIYSDFIKYISWKIDFSKIHSTFAWVLLYTYDDYNNILKKYPKLDILYKLKRTSDWFFRADREIRDYFYNLFKSLDKNSYICLDL